MSSSYSPVAVKLGNITLPNDGADYVKAAAVNVPLQAIADGVSYEYSRRRWDYRLTLSDQVSPIETITASDYTDVIQLVSASNVAVGDVVRALYTLHVACNGSMSLRLAVGPARTPMMNAFSFRSSPTADIVPIAMQGVVSVTSAMLSGSNLEVYLQAKVAAPASLVVWAPHGLAVEIERP